MKTCTRCQQAKPEQEFDKSSKRYDGLQVYCRPCKKVIDIEYYSKNKTRCITRTKEGKNAKLKWLADFKKTLKCIKCGESHPACLDFHHRDSSTKIGQIANLVKSWSIKRIKTEISKCDVLCANCHRKHHYEEKQNLGIELGATLIR